MHSTPSTPEAALLGLLARGPASGYELRKIFQTTPLGAYSDSPGAVYPALRRLEKRGFVAGRVTTGGRRRKPWQITAAGRGWLRGWAARPVTAEDVAHDSGAVDLRLALLSNVTPARLPVFLREYSDAIDTHLASLISVAPARAHPSVGRLRIVALPTHAGDAPDDHPPRGAAGLRVHIATGEPRRDVASPHRFHARDLGRRGGDGAGYRP